MKQGDTFFGLVTLHRVKQVPRAERSATRVDHVVIPAGDVRRVRPNADLSVALDAMTHEGVNQLPVMDDGPIVGILSRDRVLSFLQTAQVQEKLVYYGPGGCDAKQDQ